MIVQGIVDSFLLEILQGIHAPTDVYRMALYVGEAPLGPDTTKYTTQGEVAGQGYGAGGLILSGYAATFKAGVALLDWSNPVWPNATLTARAGLIYNLSKANRAVAVLDLGKNFTSTNGSFTVTLPDGLIGIGG